MNTTVRIPPSRPSISSAADPQTTRLTKKRVESIYVGHRYHAFEKYFDEFRTSGRYRFNFCWPAFFLGPFWHLYRKMYLTGFTYLGALIVVGVAISILSDSTPTGGGLAIGVYFAMLGRFDYWNAMNRDIDKARKLYPGQRHQALGWLENRGGVTIWPVVVWALVELWAIAVFLGEKI